MPIEATTLFVPQTINASAGRGGWQVTGSFVNSQEDIVWGRRVEVYGLGEGAGLWEEDNKLAIQGSILPQTLQFDRTQSQMNVTISTSDAFLTNAGLQGIYFSEQPAPANLHQMTDLRLGRIVKHIIEDHTNISMNTPGGWVDTSGIEILNSTSVDVYTVKQSNSIWTSIQNIADNEFYVRYFTKNDAFIYEQHPQFKAILPPVTLTLNNDNIVGDPQVQYRDDTQVDQVQLYALTDSGAILQSFYPTNIGTEGRRLKYTNLRCNSQARLNVLAERAYKYNNRELDTTIQIAGPWGIFLELYDRIAITYSGTSRNGVTLSWSDKKFWIDEIQIRRVGNFGAITELRLEEENV